MSKHTSAPWEISGQLILGPAEPLPNPKVKPRGRVIASVYWDYFGDRGATEPRTMWEEANANLHLMAAAPELLEAAETLLANLIATEETGPNDVCAEEWDGPLDGDGCPWYQDVWNLREAIAKATGGEA